ncbi:MAG: hypothetical protein BMS9Abin39_0336 [Ignavibacteria bacterium]|nr:MAG: hypothetical protein BMS9Abin39_0336 [Ignavibacteria bacterium]
MERKNLIRNTTIQRISISISILIGLILFTQMLVRTLRGDSNDFTSYLLSADALLKGNNPYETGIPFHYIYPLFPAFLLIPFSLTPLWFANIVWFLLNVIFLIYTYLLIAKCCADKNLSYSYKLGLPLVLLLIILLNVVQNNFLNGQVNIIVLLLSLIFFHYWKKGETIIAALFLAAAISIKLVPLIFLILIIQRRNYYLLIHTVIFSVIFTIVIPYLFLGNDLFGIYDNYIKTLLLKGTSLEVPVDSMFFTLSGFISYVIPTLKSVIWLKLISALLVVIALLIFSLKMKNIFYLKNSIVVISLYFLGILLVSPMSETHHLIFILPALTTVTFSIFNFKSYNKLNRINIIIFFLFYITGTFYQANPFYFLSIIWLSILLISELYSGAPVGEKLNPV